MTTKIYNSFKEFKSRIDRKTNGVSEEFALKHPFYEEENIYNSGCWNCIGCYVCYRCINCSFCYHCEDIVNKQELAYGKIQLNVPVVEDIHTKIYDTIRSGVGELNMGGWHQCETSHCRAGWATHLAGEEGKILEHQTLISFAALCIFRKSSPLVEIKKDHFHMSSCDAWYKIFEAASQEQELKFNQL